MSPRVSLYGEPKTYRVGGGAKADLAQTGFRPGVAEAESGYKGIVSGSAWKGTPQRVTVPYATTTAPRYHLLSRVARSSWNSV